jgi:HEPN domain-containing protein
LDRADEDLLAGRLILAGQMPTYDLVGFHAQQAAEKALKAVLVRHGVRFDKTHDLGQLLEQVEPVAPGTAATLAEAEELTAHAIGARYPGREPPLDRQEAASRLAVPSAVLAHVRGLLQPYLEAGRPPG